MEIDAELLTQQASDSAHTDTAAAVAAVNNEQGKELEQTESSTNQTSALDKDDKETKDNLNPRGNSIFSSRNRHSKGSTYESTKPC